MSLSRIVDISISLSARPIPLEGFGIPLLAVILSGSQDTAWDAAYGASVDVIEVTPNDYQTVMTALGISSSEDPYVALVDMFSQEDKPQTVLLGRRAIAVAQVNQVDVDGTDDGSYTITINGNDYTFAASGNTATEIKDGLIAAVDGGSDPVDADTVDTDSLDVAADEDGVPFTISVTAPSDNLTLSTTAANVGLPEDIAAWRSERDDWYFLLETTRTSGNIQAAAEVIETLRKLFVAQTNDADAQTASTDDLGTILGPTGLNLLRTVLIWHDNDDQFVDCALVGKMAPTDPGSQTWANQTLSSVSGIEPTSETNLENKNYTWLESFTAASFSMSQGGSVINGQWIDLVRGADWLQNLLQIRLVQALRDNPKIPYTDTGGDILGGVIDGGLEQGVEAGLVVAGSPFTNVPARAEQDASDRANRHFPGIEFGGDLQGAIHTIQARGGLAA